MADMGKNWVKVCKKLLPNASDEFTLADERKALHIIEKNIYHKRPSIMPITVDKVSLVHCTLVLVLCSYVFRLVLIWTKFLRVQ